MIDQVWKLIQVRLSILIKDLSRGHKWKNECNKIDKAREIAAIKSDKHEMIAELHAKIDDLKHQIKQLEIEIFDKDARYKRL